MLLGEKIHELRKQKGLTLEKLAEQVDSSKSYIWELENKPSLRPSADLVYKLSIALGVTVESLMSEVNNHTGEDQVFFRDFTKLKPQTKQQLRRILDALKEDEGKNG